MSEWKTYKLGDLIECIIDNRGKSAPISISNYQPIIEINALGQREVNYDVIRKYVSKETYDTWFRAGHPKIGDILFSTVGTIGLTSLMTQDVGCIAQNIIALRVNDKLLNNLYLYYFLNNKTTKINLNNLNIGGVQPSIKLPHLLNMPISLPPLAEQKRIADILSAIDDKIELNRRINANLEQQAQALFDEIMSCELEYDLIANIPHVIETGKRPKGGVASITSGIPSIGAENIKGLGYYDYSKTKYITEEFATTLKKGFVNGYELLIYKDGGKPGYFIPNFSIFGNGFPYNKMALNEHVFLLDFRNKGYNFFAYFYFQQEKIMRYLNAQGSKAAIPGINRNDIENISIPTIQNKVIQYFCRQTENIITHILNNASESRKLSIVRDALLPKLISGEITV